MSRFPSEWEQMAEYESRFGVGTWPGRKPSEQASAVTDLQGATPGAPVSDGPTKKPHEAQTPRTKREFLDRVIAELNLDVRDPFTLILANACALDDLRRQLERALAAAIERERLAQASLIEMQGNWEAEIVMRERAEEARDAAQSAKQERAEPLKARQLDVVGELWGLRFTSGCSHGCVELYVEDDGWWHLKATFDRAWLHDLAKVASTDNRSADKEQG